jgi:hypothetical protein
VIKAMFSGSGPRYVARFKLVEFSHAPAAVNGRGEVVAVAVQMRWQFTLTDASGNRVVAIAKTSVGPKPVTEEEEAGAMVQSLINTTLEEIGAALDKAELDAG